MIALLEAKRAGLFQRSHWLPNIASGIIVGIVALPLAVAFAIASGAKPEQGLYTAIVAGLLVSIFGGSRLQIAGPTGAFIVILSGITAKYGIDGLQIATLMAGVMLVLLGLAGMGVVIEFIPHPVILGFTAGIGVIIFVEQWKIFFGLPAIAGEYFHQKLFYLFQAMPHFHLVTAVLGFFSLILVIFSVRIPGVKKVPGPLVAMVVATLTQAIFHFEGVVTIGNAFGEIPKGLPSFVWPNVTAERVVELVGPAFAIAMLGAIESLLSAVVADSMAGTRHDSNQELIGQGIANIAAPLFGGFAATGAIARTATNIRSGGTSPLGGIMHVLTLTFILLFLTPLARHVPLAALAAILFVVAWNISEPKNIIKMIKRAPRADVVILIVTFVLTVFVDLVVAINIGVILAILQFLRRMADSVEVQQLTAKELQQELSREGFTELPPSVSVYTVHGPLFFGAVENFEQGLKLTRTDVRILIIHLRWVPFMDITGLQKLEEIIINLQKRGISVMLTGANDRVAAKLKKAGIVDLIGAQHWFATFAQALTYCRGLTEINPVIEDVVST